MPWAVCLVKHEAKSEAELALTEGDVVNISSKPSRYDTQWIYGVSKQTGRKGRFPSTCVRMADLSTLEVAACGFDWDPDPSFGSGYLPLRKDSVVQVVEKLDSGWWRGLSRGINGCYLSTTCDPA